jgi:hypothetical protein
LVAADPGLQRTPIICLMGDPERRHRSGSDERRDQLNQRLRQAFIEGAEEDSRRRLGRGLTAEELGRVLRHYPGDLPENRRR